MKRTRILKFLVVLFSMAMLLIGGIACRGQKGEKEQLASTVEITFYLTDNLYDGEWETGAIKRHTGTEPRMYVYQLRGQYGVPVYVKQSDEITDFAGRSLRDEFYKMKQDSNPIYVSESTTLIFDYEIYGYDNKGELYHAYTIRVEWEIVIDYVDVPPNHEHEMVEQYRVEPTCDAPGCIVSACACGLEETIHIDPSGHDWGAWKSDGDGVYHSRICKKDGSHVQRQKCGGGQATCLKRAVCLDCGEEFGVLANHKYENYICIYCNEPKASVALVFRLSEDKSYYIAEAREFTKEQIAILGDELKRVVVPDHYNGKPVKEIAEEGFIYNEVIEEIFISNGIERIGANAFDGCINLRQIVLPSTLQYVGNRAFRSTLYEQTADNWTDGVLYVGNWLVGAENSLTGVCNVKDGTVGVASGAFSSTKLSEINFPDSVEYFDLVENSFNHDLKKISFGAGVRAISGIMFVNYLLADKIKVTISEQNPYLKVQDNFVLSKDGKTLFWHFGEFTQIFIPDGVEKIEPYALAYRGNIIRKMHIPDSVVEIGEAAFGSSCLREIILPDSVRILGKDAFSLCRYVETLSIGAGLQEIGENALALGSSKLSAITLAEQNTAFLLDNGALYTADGKSLLLYPSRDSRTSFTVREGTETIENYAVSSANNLTEIVFPNSLRIIKILAINSCDGIRGMVIPDGVHTLEENAIYDCKGLLTVELGSGLQSVDSRAFYRSYRLLYVYNRSSLELNVFVDIVGAVYVSVPVYTGFDGGSLSTDENGFTVYTNGEEKILVDYVGEQTDIILPDGVTKIGRWAIAYDVCKVFVSSVVLPDTVKMIDEYAFCGQRKLTQVTCGTGLKEICSMAFWDCSKLEKFTLNGELDEVGSDAFRGTTFAPGNDLNSSIDGRYMEKYFLRPAYSATSFIVRDGTVLLENGSIYRASGFEYEWAVIPSSVKSLGRSSSYYSNAPKVIYYGGTQSQWLSVKYNELAANSQLYYYSQTYKENGWRYVNGEPTTWLEDSTQYEEISKVVLMTSDGVSGKIIVTRGQEIQLTAKIYPDFYQSTANVVYKVLEDQSTVKDGKLIGILDEDTGVLKITYDNGRAYSRIKIVAIADGMESNVLTFEMESVATTSIRFIPEVTYLYARPGETLTLRAKVNEDATEKWVSYSFSKETPYATMTANAGVATITFAKDFDDWAEHIYVIAQGANGVTAVQTIILLKEEYHLLLNNQIEDVYLYADESMVLTAEDGEGNAISLADITLKIYDEYWNETDDLTVGANGELIFKEGVIENLTENTKYIFESSYGDGFSCIFLEVMIKPSKIFVGVAQQTVKVGDYIDLNIIAQPIYEMSKSARIKWSSYGIVEVVDRDTLYVLPTAKVGDSVTIYVEWTDAYGTTSLMRYYTINIEE